VALNFATAVTRAFARRLTERATCPALEVGTTPPNEIASEPSKVTFAIKINKFLLSPRAYVRQQGLPMQMGGNEKCGSLQ
jgi:hypothetical protein